MATPNARAWTPGHAFAVVVQVVPGLESRGGQVARHPIEEFMKGGRRYLEPPDRPRQFAKHRIPPLPADRGIEGAAMTVETLPNGTRGPTPAAEIHGVIGDPAEGVQGVGGPSFLGWKEEARQGEGPGVPPGNVPAVAGV
jgi:hypothetical protein